jgi:hypothetical protein
MDSLLRLAEVAASLDGSSSERDVGEQILAAPRGMPQSAGIMGDVALQLGENNQDAQPRNAATRSSTATVLQLLQELKDAIVTQQQASHKQQQQQECNQDSCRTSPTAGQQNAADAGYRSSFIPPDSLNVDDNQPFSKNHQMLFDQHLKPRPAAAAAPPPPPPPPPVSATVAAVPACKQAQAPLTSSPSAAVPSDDSNVDEDDPLGAARRAAGSTAGSRQLRRWCKQEQSKLEQLVELHNLKAWRLVAEQLPGSPAQQCRERYLNDTQQVKKVRVWRK